MENKPLLDFIWIGYPKTASTWWQKFGFKLHPDIQLINGLPNDIQRKKIRDILIQLSEKNDEDIDMPKIEKDLRDLVSSNREQYKKVGICAERLSGGILKEKVSPQIIANRIRRVFGKTKIFIFIRNQITMIESVYSQYIAQGGVLPLNEFLKDDQLPGKHVLECLCYHHLIDHYVDLFGRENVFIGLYEDFKNDKKLFIKSVYSYCGANKDFLPKEINLLANVKMHPYVFSINRFFNKVFGQKYIESWLRLYFVRKILDRGIFNNFFKGTRLLGREQREFLFDFFKESNRALQDKYSLELSKNDYPL